MTPPQEQNEPGVLPWGAPALPPQEPGDPVLVGLPDIPQGGAPEAGDFLDLSPPPATPPPAAETPAPGPGSAPSLGEASDLEVSGTLAAGLRTALDRLRSDTGAVFVSLLDCAGFELASSGTPTSGSGSAEAGALAAGSFAAVRELATRLGGTGAGGFGGLLHEGGQSSFFLAPCGTTALLLVSFTPPVPAGIVRLAARRTAGSLAGLVG